MYFLLLFISIISSSKNDAYPNGCTIIGEANFTAKYSFSGCNEQEEKALHVLINKKYQFTVNELDNIHDSIICSSSSVEELEKNLNTSKGSGSNDKRKVLVNLENGKLEVLEKPGIFDYLYSEHINLDWEIFDEERLINSYMCQRATAALGGRKYEAWFAKFFPLPAGPDIFHGLPGIIVQLRSEDGDIQFNLEGFRKADRGVTISFYAKSVRNSTKKEVNKFIQYKYEDPMAFLKSELPSLRFENPERAEELIKGNVSNFCPLELN